MVFSSVIQNLDNWINLIAYSRGFATGNVVGMWLEEKIALGYTHLQIISSTRGAAVAERLRDSGFAVTEFSGRGKDGMVTMLSVSVKRKNMKSVHNLVQGVDDDAFITAEDLQPLRRGFWRMPR